jgi:hypothetical protein
VSDNYQRWLNGEIGDSELNRRQAQTNRLFTLEEVHVLELSAAKATEERIIKLLEKEREKHIPWCGDTQPCAKCNQTIGLETAIARIEGENK